MAAPLRTSGSGAMHCALTALFTAIPVIMHIMPASASSAPTVNLQRCLAPDEFDAAADIDYFPNKFVPHPSTDLFTITYHKTYKIVTNKFQDKSYLLYQCGTTPPRAEVDSGGHHLVLPVPLAGGVAVTETPQIPPMELLGLRRDVKAYIGNPIYVSSPCLDYMIDEEKSITIIFDPDDPFNGTKTQADTDEWLSDHPESVIVGGPYGNKDGDRVLSVAASQERTNVATFDWIGVYAALFNLEAMATDIVNETEERYVCSSSNAAALSADLPEEDKPTMLWANYFEGYGWSVAECPTWDSAYYCEYSKHCGSDILERPEGVGWNNPDYGGLYWYLNDTELLQLGGNADYWIYPSKTWDSVYERKKDVLDRFKSVQNKQVYDTQGQGPHAWYEQRLAEYDVVALDYCDIVGRANPASNPPHVRRWFRNLFTEGIGFQPPCDVPDGIDEPYVPNEAVCDLIGGGDGGGDGTAPAPNPSPSAGSARSYYSALVGAVWLLQLFAFHLYR